MMNNNNNNKASSSSSTPISVDLDAINAQVIDLTDIENVKPKQQRTLTLKRGQHPRKLPINVASKKMMLPYENNNMPTTFFGYKMYYLARAQHLVMKSKVKLFQCNTNLSTTDIRLGVAEIDEHDRISLTKMLNNVAGSLPVTTRNVRRPIEEGEDVLFVSLKRKRASVFDHRGALIAIDKMPKVCEAMLALQIGGMKVKDDCASFIMSVEQIMVKKSIGGDANGDGSTTPKLLFDVSSEDEDEMIVG